MRNKRNFQKVLGDIESIQQSFIQFIRNTQLTEGERTVLENQINASKQAFEQMRTFLNQEEEVYNTPMMKAPQHQINSGRF
jgi:hypothetical protein